MKHKKKNIDMRGRGSFGIATTVNGKRAIDRTFQTRDRAELGVEALQDAKRKHPYVRKYKNPRVVTSNKKEDVFSLF